RDEIIHLSNFNARSAGEICPFLEESAVSFSWITWCTCSPSSSEQVQTCFIPTATLLEHALLAQGFMGVSKVAFPRRLQLQYRDSTGANLSNALKCRCRVICAHHERFSLPEPGMTVRRCRGHHAGSGVRRA